MSCEASGSGDVVGTLSNLAEQFKAGALPAENPDFPSLLSVDVEIYHERLRNEIGQIFPGRSYIPSIPDSPLLANSPMVFMTPESLAKSLQNTPNLFNALTKAKTHQDLDASSQALPIHYIHTAPVRSNSGLQTLVTQFSAAPGKRPEDMTPADVKKYQSQIQAIQSKITRYGTSTGSLARDMVANGPYIHGVQIQALSQIIAAPDDQAIAELSKQWQRAD